MNNYLMSPLVVRFCTYPSLAHLHFPLHFYYFLVSIEANLLEFEERPVKDAGDTNGGGWGYKRMGKYT